MTWSNPVADTSGTQALVPPLRALNVDLAGNAYTLINGAVPVAQAQTSNVNGTLQNAQTGNANGTILALLGSASVILTVNMASGFTGTVNFEVTEDNTNWAPLQVQQEGTNNIVISTTGATTTAVTLYEGSVAGLQSLRARTSGVTAGNVTVTAHAIPTTDASRVVNANVVPFPTIIQKAKNVSTAGVASLAQAFASNNVAGNSIIVVCGVGNGTAATVTDSANNTYTLAINGNNSSTFAAQIFYAVNIAGGANTVTVTPSASVSVAMEIYEVSGLIAQITNVLDQTTSATGTSATPSGNNIASVSPNALAFMGVAVGTAAQASSVTAGSNWTLDSTQNVGGSPSGLFSFGAFSQALGNVTSAVVKATIAGSEPFAIAAATFKPVTLGVQGTVQIGGYNYTRVTSAATTLVKTGPGILHAIVVNKPTSTATIEADDALTNTTPVIGILGAFTASIAPFGVTYDVAFTTGLSVTVGTAAVDATIVWK